MSHATVASLQSGIYLFPEFTPDAVAAFSTRQFEASKDLPSFLKSLGLNPNQFSTIKQVHGERVIVVPESTGEVESQAMEADGLITNGRNLALVIRTADCIPLFFLDTETPAVGMCHAGWRGAEKGIVPRMVEMLRENFDTKPASLRVGIGPSIRESCYEVGGEFENYFPGQLKRKGEKYFLDLVAVVKGQLVEAGVSEEEIFDSQLCTVCSVDTFFSARREGIETGRFLSAIVLK